MDIWLKKYVYNDSKLDSLSSWFFQNKYLFGGHYYSSKTNVRIS